MTIKLELTIMEAHLVSEALRLQAKEIWPNAREILPEDYFSTTPKDRAQNQILDLLVGAITDMGSQAICYSIQKKIDAFIEAN